MKTGEYSDKDNGRSHVLRRRWCAGCDQFHGVLYICSEYPDSVKAQLAIDGSAWSLRLRDPAWQARQLENGVPQEVLDTFAALDNR